MLPSGMLSRVTIVRTDVSEVSISSIIRVTRIGELRKLAIEVRCEKYHVLRSLVTANVFSSSPILVTLMTEAILSSEASVLTSVTRRHIPRDGILHSHRRGNLNSYISLTGWAI
jgi:hypothetical protein